MTCNNYKNKLGNWLEKARNAEILGKFKEMAKEKHMKDCKAKQSVILFKERHKA